MPGAIGSNSRCRKVDRKGPGGSNQNEKPEIGPHTARHSDRDSHGIFSDFTGRDEPGRKFATSRFHLPRVRIISHQMVLIFV